MTRYARTIGMAVAAGTWVLVSAARQTRAQAAPVTQAPATQAASPPVEAPAPAPPSATTAPGTAATAATAPAGTATAATAPATTASAGAIPTSSAAVMPPPTVPPMPQEYAATLARNVFTRGTAKAGGPVAPEAGLGLTGVVADDGKFTAFVEDLAAKRTLRLKAGDPLVGGRVKSVTEDALEYEAAGKVTRVQIGQNLLGAPLPPPPPPPPPAAPAGQPGGPGGPPQPGGPGQPGLPPGVRRGQPG
jgi:hypothetical protein